jgi:hypothetical protein
VRWQAALHKFRRERRIADMPRASGAGRSDANDPLAVSRQAILPRCTTLLSPNDVLGCGPRPEG